jgi:hypothetical protein
MVDGKMIWPFNDNKNMNIPEDGTEGGFLEDRKDRFHCGVDIYAPRGEPILSIEDGTVLDVSVFTSPERVSYWNDTVQILFKADSGIFYRYAELEGSLVEKGKQIHEGDTIGYVGQVLNPKVINRKSPEYIQRLVQRKKLSMLHLETYTKHPTDSRFYLGGNWFGTQIPSSLISPHIILRRIQEK